MMKVKNAVSVVLLVFVAASVVYLIAGESRSRSDQEQTGPPRTVSEPTPTETASEQTATTTTKEPVGSTDKPVEVAEAPTVPQHKLVAYYFHRTQRCRTCLNMEAYAEDALRKGFADVFESGKLDWRAINVEEPQHEHFVEEYELTASALVMVLFENGEQKQFKNLERVWELVSDESGFKEYVKDEALAYLESGS
jgi:hypothetical protein